MRYLYSPEVLFHLKQFNTMAIQFDFYQSPRTTSDSPEHYHPRVVNSKHIDTDDLAKEIHAASTLSKADIKAVLTSLSEALGSHLKEGARVHIEGLGYFQISLTCTESANPRTTRADKIKIKNIHFRPDKTLKAELKNIEVQRSPVKKHSPQWSAAEIDQKVMEYFQTHETLTRHNLETLCQLTRCTAIRQIHRLVSEHKIRNVASCKNPVYMKV